jgi:hypothetical protein
MQTQPGLGLGAGDAVGVKVVVAVEAAQGPGAGVTNPAHLARQGFAKSRPLRDGDGWCLGWWGIRGEKARLVRRGFRV